ncbi:MAG: hypothetical protein V4511_04300 [Bacteroidota bacterium]
MSTAELKSNLYKLIESINDSKTLNAIYTLITEKKKQEVDWWNELTEEQKVGIERGLKDMKAGRVYTHEQVMAKSKTVISRYKKLAK